MNHYRHVAQMIKNMPFGPLFPAKVTAMSGLAAATRLAGVVQFWAWQLSTEILGKQQICY